MPNPEIQPSHDALRAIEAEFRSRPDHQQHDATPALITMPSELEFQRLAAEREAHEDAERERRIATYKEWREKEKRDRRVSRLKKAMAVAAVVMTVKSGGFIDMAGDQFSDAGQVAADAVEAPDLAEYMPEDKIDGIPLEEYPKDAQDEWVQEAHETVESIQEARTTVIDLFQRADEDGYDGIVSEVAEYRDAHGELFMGNEQIEAALESIDGADTNKAALEALQGFMDFYGIKAGFHEDSSFDDRQGEVKEIAKAYVDVFSVLPKDFVALAKLERVTVSGGAVTSSHEEPGTEAGTFSPDENAINVVAMGKVMDIVMPVEGFLERTEFSYRSVVAHELGHALDEHQLVDVFLPEDKQPTEISGGAIFEHIGKNIINRPEAPSVYAMSADEEYSAELKSGVLSDTSDGLASVNEWRKFGSESNKAMIETLVELERVYPGIAKILIANRA